MLSNNNNRQQQNDEAHRVAAELADGDPVREGLIVDFDVEGSVSVVHSVLLDEVQVLYTCNLQAGKGASGIDLLIYFFEKHVHLTVKCK